MCEYYCPRKMQKVILRAFVPFLDAVVVLITLQSDVHKNVYKNQNYIDKKTRYVCILN